MNKPRRKTLEKKGWKVGTAEEFRGLSPEESRCIEMKLATSKTGSGHTLGTLERTKMNRNDTFGLCRKRFFMFDSSQRRPVEKMAAHSGHL